MHTYYIRPNFPNSMLGGSSIKSYSIVHKVFLLLHCMINQTAGVHNVSESLVKEIIALKYVLINGSHLFQAALFYIGINIQQYGAFLTKP